MTGGGGFYRKVTSFTNPQVFTATILRIAVNVVIGEFFSTNQGGWNAALATRMQAAGDGTMKLFAEARYLYVPYARRYESQTDWAPPS